MSSSVAHRRTGVPSRTLVRVGGLLRYCQAGQCGAVTSSRTISAPASAAYGRRGHELASHRPKRERPRAAGGRSQRHAQTRSACKIVVVPEDSIGRIRQGPLVLAGGGRGVTSTTTCLNSGAGRLDQANCLTPLAVVSSSGVLGTRSIDWWWRLRRRFLSDSLACPAAGSFSAHRKSSPGGPLPWTMPGLQ